MSLEQGAAFAKGLRALSDDFRLESRTRAEDYGAALQEMNTELKAIIDKVVVLVEDFQAESQDFAKDMVQRADQYVDDIVELHHDVYGDGEESGEETA